MLSKKIALQKSYEPELDIVLLGEFVLSGLVNYCPSTITGGKTAREMQALYLEFLPASDEHVVACGDGMLCVCVCVCVCVFFSLFFSSLLMLFLIKNVEKKTTQNNKNTKI